MNTHHNHHVDQSPTEDAKFDINIVSHPQRIEAGKTTHLSIAITKNGKNVDLEIVHEMKIHLLIMNEDLSWFDHIHPEEQPDGTYSVTEIFPTAGNYLLFMDYRASHAAGHVHLKHLAVYGNPIFQPAILEPKLISTSGDYTVRLLNGNDLRTNQNQRLQFTIEKAGNALLEKDLQPYLGANAHIVMVGKTDYDFLHIHPVADRRFPIYAETHMDKPGLYRMWVQFKIEGNIHTADFTVSVSPGETQHNNHQQHHQHA